MSNDFLVDNIEWVLTLVFMAGGGWFLLKSLAAKIDSQTEAMDRRFDGLDDKDKVHDKSIIANERANSENDKRITVLESRFDETIGAMKGQIAEIYQKLIG